MRLRKSPCVFMLLALVCCSNTTSGSVLLILWGSIRPSLLHQTFICLWTKIQPHHIIPVMFILSSVSVVILTVLLTVRSDRVEASCLSLVCRCCRHALLLVVVACMVSLPSCLPPVSCFIAARLLQVGYCWTVEYCIMLYVSFLQSHSFKIYDCVNRHYFPLTGSGLKVLNHKMEILKRNKPAESINGNQTPQPTEGTSCISSSDGQTSTKHGSHLFSSHAKKT